MSRETRFLIDNGLGYYVGRNGQHFLRSKTLAGIIDGFCMMGIFQNKTKLAKKLLTYI